MLKKFILPLFLATAIFAEEEVAKKETDLKKVSEAFGHLIGSNLTTLGFEFDAEQVMKGLKDSLSGGESPLSETETVQAISAIQEEAFQKTSQKNLDEANAFLKENASKEDIVAAEEGKLLYHIETKGNGEEVQPNYSPLIKYKGTFIDGKVFGASEESERINLDETIPGFAKGIIGMKEGEKRIVHIHPELGYGTSGYLPPNSLLTFEIEVVKANEPEATGETLTSINEIDENNADIAEEGDVLPVR